MEKASFEKIQRLLEISEREWHHEILLIVKNLRDLSSSQSPYTITVIPHHLPVEIVEGEHYVSVDLLNLAPGSSSSTKNSEAEAVGRELVIINQPGQPSSAREDSGLTPLASKKKDDRGSLLEHPPIARKGPRPTPQASKKGRWAPEWLKAPRAGVEDFVPWVSSTSSRPPAKEEEEEEEEDKMVDLVHNFSARKSKRGATFMRATVATPDMASEASQQPLNKSSDVQAIVISDLPEMGFHG